jgi:BASS family bile acid:Na+ symporter
LITSLPLSALAWIGRQGTSAIAALVFIGIALPPLDALLRPFVTPAIFALLCLAFLRVEPAALRAHARRPGLVLAATGWTMVALPALTGLGFLAVGVDTHAPDLMLALMLQTVACPMMAAPSFAAAMGLDASLVLAVLIASSIATPLSAPLFAALFVGDGLQLSPLTLGLKLLAILAGSALLAAAIRRLVGAAAIARHKQPLDGLNILVVFVFVGAVMEHVAADVAAAPARMLGLTALAFALFALTVGLTALLFARAGRARALALGLAAAQRNMGLMLAATAGALPDLAWLWFALCQFPIYVSPQLLKRLAQRLHAYDTAVARANMVKST